MQRDMPRHTVSFSHRGHSGRAFYNEEGGYYHGYVSGTGYPIDIRGTTEEEVGDDFRNKVDEYLDSKGASR